MAQIQLTDFSMNVEVIPGLFPMDTLFLHGNLASNTWWKPSIEIWKQNAKPGYEGRGIFAEWRGCGRSSHPKEDSELSMHRLTEDCVELTEKLNIKKSCVVGHSTGGLIALMALMKAPQIFDRAVLLDSVASNGVYFAPDKFEAYTQMRQNKEFCAMIMGITIHQNDATSPLFAEIVNDAYNVGKLNWHGVPKALMNIDVTDQLDRVKQPVLVLHGEHDIILPKEESEKMAARLPNGKYVELKGQGHSTNVENPALFAKLVEDFLFNRP